MAEKQSPDASDRQRSSGVVSFTPWSRLPMHATLVARAWWCTRDESTATENLRSVAATVSLPLSASRSSRRDPSEQARASSEQNRKRRRQTYCWTFNNF